MPLRNNQLTWPETKFALIGQDYQLLDNYVVA